MHNILNTLWEWTEGSPKTDFGPAKAVGRSQTWPMEVLGLPSDLFSTAGIGERLIIRFIE